MKLLLLIALFACCNAKSIPKGYYHSDVIVTNWPTTVKDELIENDKSLKQGQGTEEPGLMRKTLLKFGEMASKIGNAMGGHASKITAALDKICEVVKTVVPLLAAVCHVGQFGFCAATDEAPIKLSEAMNAQTLNLDALD
ncbi:uncharacterized protein LOC126747853 [Anthonomus grandis grandis]|uniref:uncharacterized protein LOC126747853 n=1 Tax=Anthonomus grandis grandis TaxID=2921223 RepID=UPI002166308C|nr:uncharacterized protein LOC126747853 [Anthonomus grandis grandis]